MTIGRKEGSQTAVRHVEGEMPAKKSRQIRQQANRNSMLIRSNFRRVRATWGKLPQPALDTLKKLSEAYALELAAGELQFFDNRWYVTGAGLLRIARRRHCAGITTAIEGQSDPAADRWIFRAIVYKSKDSLGFVGHGDADPSNVSPLVRGAEMRVAETRAVNRALRKAYGVGLCTVEELGWTPKRIDPEPPKANGSIPAGNGANGHSSGQPRLRDRLCLIIRRHRLDTALVKAYAADYCGTPTLNLASRESVEAFISHLAERAANDREALLCHLNSYAKAPEAQP